MAEFELYFKWQWFFKYLFCNVYDQIVVMSYFSLVGLLFFLWAFFSRSDYTYISGFYLISFQDAS